MNFFLYINCTFKVRLFIGIKGLEVMEKIKIGIAREGKIPPDNRVPLAPWEVIEAQNIFPAFEIVCQTSNVRCFPDEMYSKLNIPVVDDLDDCDILLGIKEFQTDDLIPGKTYLFFSHVIKKQAHNKELLRAILDKKIRLIEYECLTDIHGKRILAFGRFAGIVGAYNGLLCYGKKYNLYDIKRAFECSTYMELKSEYQKMLFPPIKIVLTGHGSVGHGAREVLENIGIKEVTVHDFLNHELKDPVFTQLHSRDYYKRFDDTDFDREEFHRSPHFYKSDFNRFASKADILINGSFWNKGADRFFSIADMLREDFRIRVIADISCDLNGPIPSTLRTSTIEYPFYDFDPFESCEKEPFSDDRNVTVMAVDNLPNELPREASNSFGRVIIEKIFPNIIYGDEDEMIARATITDNGKLTARYKYLYDFVYGQA
jgi:alanine dehydrogenase